MRAQIAVAMMAAMATYVHASPDIDYVEAYHSCDETASFDFGFAEAGLPRDKIGGSVYPQLGGQWQGQDLIVLAVKTTTGTVFCMTTLDYRVVQYKFNGRIVILRD